MFLSELDVHIVIIPNHSGVIMTDFVNLHNQTEFSLLDSLITVKGLFQQVKEMGQSAVAITDHGSFSRYLGCL